MKAGCIYNFLKITQWFLFFHMITQYDRLKILGTVIVTSYKSKRSGYASEKLNSYLGERICQNR